MSKILIIDDDKKILISFGHKLKKSGFDIITAENAFIGLSYLQKEEVDLVLLDYAMPEMNGLEAFEHFKKQIQPICPPVIMMTFNTDYKIATQFIQAGGADFVEKNVNPEELKIKIRRVIQDHSKVKQATNKQFQAEEKLKATNELLLEKTKLLKLQAEALADSNQELKNFVDIVAHDLKEPLRNISNSLQFFKWDFGDNIDEKASEYIEFAISGAVRLSHMIHGLTFYANVNSVLPFEEANFLEIIDAVKANLKGQIEESETQIILDESLPETIIAHKYQLIQLFQNLVSNAIKFKKDNQNPIIHIKLLENLSHWKFSVIDNGIGFDKVYAKRIFNIFQRLHSPQDYKGSGIGLSICQKIIERHDGEISATSEDRKGATFTFSISKNLV